MSRPINEVLLVTDVNPNSPISESYRALRTNTQFAAAGRLTQVIAVTSCEQSEGKTTTVANLAISFAQEGKKTLLIDADLRKPGQHKAFSISNRKGLSNYLAAQNELEQSLAATHIEHLTLLPAGQIPPNPAELLSSKRMDELLQKVREEYEIILIDTPPVLAVTDAQIAAAKSDGVLLVLRAGKVKKGQATKAKAALEHVGSRILGLVINDKKKSPGDYAYYEYGN